MAYLAPPIYGKKVTLSRSLPHATQSDEEPLFRVQIIEQKSDKQKGLALKVEGKYESRRVRTTPGTVRRSGSPVWIGWRS